MYIVHYWLFTGEKSKYKIFRLITLEVFKKKKKNPRKIVYSLFNLQCLFFSPKIPVLNQNSFARNNFAQRYDLYNKIGTFLNIYIQAKQNYLIRG